MTIENDPGNTKKHTLRENVQICSLLQPSHVSSRSTTINVTLLTDCMNDVGLGDTYARSSSQGRLSVQKCFSFLSSVKM